jgi:hypothetical protein
VPPLPKDTDKLKRYISETAASVMVYTHEIVRNRWTTEVTFAMWQRKYTSSLCALSHKLSPFLYPTRCILWWLFRVFMQHCFLVINQCFGIACWSHQGVNYPRVSPLGWDWQAIPKVWLMTTKTMLCKNLEEPTHNNSTTAEACYHIRYISLSFLIVIPKYKFLTLFTSFVKTLYYSDELHSSKG